MYAIRSYYAAYNHTWEDPHHILTVGVNDPSPVVEKGKAAGIYNITYKVSSGGCTGTINSTVAISDCRTEEICKGEDLKLTVPSGANVIGWTEGTSALVGDEPVVSPSASTTYTIRYFNEQTGNLIPFGNFEGDPGAIAANITSTYTYKDMITEDTGLNGQYSIGPNPEAFYDGWITGFTPKVWFWDIDDNTKGDGTGGMFMANGIDEPNRAVISVDVDVVSGIDYVFSGYFANIHIDHENPYQLQFFVNDKAVGVDFNGDKDHDWKQFYEIWTANVTGKVTVEIRNQSKAGLGNDFAIDDLVFTPIVEEDVVVTVHENPTITFDPQSLCELSGEAIKATAASIPATTGIKAFNWSDGSNILLNTPYPTDATFPTLANTATPNTYLVDLEVEDNNGCKTLEEDVAITVNKLPSLSLSNTIVS